MLGLETVALTDDGKGGEDAPEDLHSRRQGVTNSEMASPRTQARDGVRHRRSPRGSPDLLLPGESKFMLLNG